MSDAFVVPDILKLPVTLFRMSTTRIILLSVNPNIKTADNTNKRLLFIKSFNNATQILTLLTLNSLLVHCAASTLFAAEILRRD